jgi:predicted DNA-binding transcriptional regulator AlpA
MIALIVYKCGVSITAAFLLGDFMTLPNGVPDSDILLNTRQAAKLISVSDRMLEGMRSRGGGPTYVEVSAKCIRYRYSDLVEWIESRTKKSTNQKS